MSEWHCDRCGINYSEKPTYTTTCPKCGFSLMMGLKTGLKDSKSEKVNNRYCAMCGEKIVRAEDALRLIEPQIFEEEPLVKKSGKIHKMCFAHLMSDEFEELPENIIAFRKMYAVKK